MAYMNGDIAEYGRAIERTRDEIAALRGRVLIAHHGDCDGIVGGGLLARWISARSSGSVELRLASAAEFRRKDFSYFESEALNCDAGIFVEAQAMTSEYAALDGKFINIDHHPHPQDTPITRMLNPRNYGILPNPAISLVMYELCGRDLPKEAKWFAALGSIVDYCPSPAKEVIDECEAELADFEDLRDTFLAVQYALPFTTELAAFVSELPSPTEFLARQMFAERRRDFRNRIDDALRSAMVGPRIVTAETMADDFRIASPLANRLQDMYDGRCIVVMEENRDQIRCSVRFRNEGTHLGRILAEITECLGAGDGSGHEMAGSARVPPSRKRDFLTLLEERIG